MEKYIFILKICGILDTSIYKEDYKELVFYPVIIMQYQIDQILEIINNTCIIFYIECDNKHLTVHFFIHNFNYATKYKSLPSSYL